MVGNAFLYEVVELLVGVGVSVARLIFAAGDVTVVFESFLEVEGSDVVTVHVKRR